MRVTRGLYKGLSIKRPKVQTVRPTRSFVKEQLFNILEHRYNINWPEHTFADLFAGSGQIGIEALSRGCHFVTFIDANLKFLKENLKTIDSAHYRCLRIDLSKQIPPLSESIFFADPPYDDRSLFENIFKHGKSDLLCLESRHNLLTENYAYVLDRQVKTGTSSLYFFRKKA